MWELVTNIKIGETSRAYACSQGCAKKKDCLAYKKVCKFKTSLIKFNNAFKKLVTHIFKV